MSHEQMLSMILESPVQMAIPLLAALPFIAKAVSSIAGGRSKARVQEAALNADQDKLALDRASQDAANTRANVATDTAFRNDARGNALRGDLLQGIEDYSVARPDGVPTGRATGGLRPSALGNRKALGKQFEDDAIARLISGPGLKTETPELTPNPKAGKLDKLLNVVNFLSSAGSAIGKLKGSADVPEIDVTSGVSSNPNSFLKSLPSLSAEDVRVQKPITSTYIPPKFTPRTFR